MTTPTSPRRQYRQALRVWPAYLATLFVICACIASGASSSGYEWNWAGIARYVYDMNSSKPGPLLEGLWITLKITAASFVLTMLLGIAAALGRLFGSPVIRLLTRVYLELIRNTPLMVQLFIIYFVLGPMLGIDRFWAAVLALSLFEGAYASEIVRSGLLAVPKEQWQAAWTLGLSTPQTLLRVITPQTAPMLLPPLTSLSISLLKDSALVSTIAVYDLTMQAQMLVSRTFSALETWLVVAFMYGFLALLISLLGTWLEKKAAARW